MNGKIVMNTPCIGTLQKTHLKSYFKRFHVTSEMARYVFSNTPRLSCDGDEIVTLQIMSFGDNELLMEYVYKSDYEDNSPGAEA